MAIFFPLSTVGLSSCRYSVTGRCVAKWWWYTMVAVYTIHYTYIRLLQYGNNDFLRLNGKENIIQKRTRVHERMFVLLIDTDLLTQRRCRMDSLSRKMKRGQKENPEQFLRFFPHLLFSGHTIIHRDGSASAVLR